MVEPADRAQRGPYVRTGRCLGRVPLQGRDPARHPLDDQCAVVRIRRDQPRHPHRRAVPDERAVAGYFVPERARPTPASDPVEHLATAVLRPVVPTRSTERPLRRSTCTGANSGQIRCTAAIAVRSWAPCGPDRSESPAERLGADPRQPSCPAGTGAESGSRPRTRGVEEGPLPPGGRAAAGRGGHGGRCCVHGGDRSLRVPATFVRCPAPADPVHPGECFLADRVGVAHSYLTPVASGTPSGAPWRTLANSRHSN